MNVLRSVALAVILAVAPFAAAPVQAQYMQPYPGYTVEVAPGAYVVRGSGTGRSYPYVSCGRDCTAPVQHRRAARARSRHHQAVEALPHKPARSRGHFNTTKIVRDPPVVIEHRRVVDDPPRIVERRRYVEDAPPAREHAHERHDDLPASKTPRVIRAEAEVTILGPDRMSIRLFRKRSTQARAQTRQ